MTSISTTIGQLQQTPDPNVQGGRLRTIRNAIIGNETRKAAAISSGLIPALTACLRDTFTQSTTSYTEVAGIVSLISHEGPSYTQPILESDVIPLLLQRSCQSPSPREAIAIIRCLNTVAANLPSKEPGRWLEDGRLAECIYDDAFAASLVRQVQGAGTSSASQQICDLALGLICKTCRTEKHKRTLVDAGLLQVLTHRLASFAVSEGLVVPSLETLDFPSAAASSLPNPAPAHAHLSPGLETIALLIENSQDRIDLLLNDPSLTAVLPQPKNDFLPTEVRHAQWGLSLLSGSSLARQRYRNAFDGLLPVFQLKEKTNTPNHLNFPPLGTAGPPPRRRPSSQAAASSVSTLKIIPESQDEKHERTIVPFLLLLARESRGKRRFLACKLLVILATHECTSTARLRSFAGLLVPILVKMMDVEVPSLDKSRSPSGLYLCSGADYMEAAPAVLAELIRDDPELQKVAVEAKAIVKLAIGLRSTFSTPALKARLWRPFKSTEMDMQICQADCVLGHGGPSRDLRREMAYREGTLRALAAIAPFDDDYRKQICDQGVLAEIILSMEPFGAQNSGADNRESVTGNSTSTILAACGAVRALTRSVTALRTKLVDAEVAKTVIKLMNSTDLEVRIAATKVLTNLAMDFSPMKESVGDSAVVKKLCEQAHSANARLRLESIWALKQLVVNAPRKLKQEVVNELGSSWIKLLIRTDPYDIPQGEVIGLVDKDYPPRSNFGDAEDVVMSEDSDGEESMTYADASSEHISEEEDDFDKHTPEDDLAIQEQVLDLIRNIFVTSTLSETAADLVDYVLQEMGTEEFFQIMKTRISPKTMYGPTRKDNHVTPPPAGVVTRVLYIILHIAACSQKWRMAIASEHELLKRILSFASHAEREVRANCCWLAINLMFEDEVSDRASCRRRANELSKLGYRLQLQKLENDPDLDVRERAKTAMTLFSTLLDQR